MGPAAVAALAGPAGALPLLASARRSADGAPIAIRGADGGGSMILSSNALATVFGGEDDFTDTSSYDASTDTSSYDTSTDTSSYDASTDTSSYDASASASSYAPSGYDASASGDATYTGGSDTAYAAAAAEATSPDGSYGSGSYGDGAAGATDGAYAAAAAEAAAQDGGNGASGAGGFTSSDGGFASAAAGAGLPDGVASGFMSGAAGATGEGALEGSLGAQGATSNGDFGLGAAGPGLGGGSTNGSHSLVGDVTASLGGAAEPGGAATALHAGNDFGARIEGNAARGLEGLAGTAAAAGTEAASPTQSFKDDPDISHNEDGSQTIRTEHGLLHVGADGRTFQMERLEDGTTRHATVETNGNSSETIFRDNGSSVTRTLDAMNNETSRTTFSVDHATGLRTEVNRMGNLETRVETNTQTGTAHTSWSDGVTSQSTTVDAKGNVTGTLVEDGQRTFTKFTGDTQGNTTFDTSRADGVKLSGTFKDGVDVQRESWANRFYGYDKTTTIADGRSVTIDKTELGIGIAQGSMTQTTIREADGTTRTTTEHVSGAGIPGLAWATGRVTTGANGGVGVDVQTGPGGSGIKAGGEIRAGADGFRLRAEAAGVFDSFKGGFDVSSLKDPVTQARQDSFKVAAGSVNGELQFGEVRDERGRQIGEFNQARLGASAPGASADLSFGTRVDETGRREQATFGTKVAGVSVEGGRLSTNGQSSWVGSVGSWLGRWGNVVDLSTGRPRK